MNKIELFKPLLRLKESIIFDDFGDPYNPKFNLFRLIVISYNQNDDTYYYLKLRDGTRIDKNTNKLVFKTKLKKEVLIKEIDNNLFIKNSYVDCSQIFKIGSDLLESLIETNCYSYNNIKSLSNDDKHLILNKIIKYCTNPIPYISVLEVFKIGNKIKANSLYLCDKKIDDILEDDRNGEYDYYNISKYRSEKQLLKELELKSFLDGFLNEYNISFDNLNEDKIIIKNND